MGWFKAVVPMEMSDEKPPVSSLLDDCRGACGDAGGGPATRLLRGGPTGRRHRRAHAGARTIINPSTSLSAPATSPLQQQEQDDYATQLRSAQHDLLLQNPSGSTRPEMGLSRALNGFTPQ